MHMAPLGETMTLEIPQTDKLVGDMFGAAFKIEVPQPLTGSTEAIATPSDIPDGQRSPCNTPRMGVASSAEDAPVGGQNGADVAAPGDVLMRFLDAIAKMAKGLDARDSGLLEKMMLGGN